MENVVSFWIYFLIYISVFKQITLINDFFRLNRFNYFNNSISYIFQIYYRFHLKFLILKNSCILYHSYVQRVSKPFFIQLSLNILNYNTVIPLEVIAVRLMCNEVLTILSKSNLSFMLYYNIIRNTLYTRKKTAAFQKTNYQ